MNKKEYINQVDNIKASEELKNKILELEAEGKPVMKKSTFKIASIVAACFAVVIVGSALFVPFSSADKYASEKVEMYSNGEASDEMADGEGISTSTSSSTNSQKLIKTASLDIETEKLDNFITSLDKIINDYKAVKVSVNEETYSYGKSLHTTVNVPAENLEEFIDEISKIGTVKTKNINADDVSDSYSALESEINALKKEEQTLLSMLEKGENLTDVIAIQDRLTTVRADIDTKSMTFERLKNQIKYSAVTINVSQVNRVSGEGNKSVGERIKKQFSDNLYYIGEFFTDFFVNFVSAIPYITILAVIAVIVILIVKRIRKNR